MNGTDIRRPSSQLAADITTALRLRDPFAASSWMSSTPRGTWTLGLRSHSGYVPLGTVPAPVNVKNEGVASRITRSVLERFGPVRTLKPGIVVDATVEALQPNKRKSCGYNAHGLTLSTVHLDGAPGTTDTVERLVERFGAIGLCPP